MAVAADSNDFLIWVFKLVYGDEHDLQVKRKYSFTGTEFFFGRRELLLVKTRI